MMIVPEAAEHAADAVTDRSGRWDLSAGGAAHLPHAVLQRDMP
jgi:hypothetical protein